MNQKRSPKYASYKAGFVLIGIAFGVGFLGVNLFDELLSSSQFLTYGFVGLVTGIGLAGAVVFGRTFWLRNNPFRRV